MAARRNADAALYGIDNTRGLHEYGREQAIAARYFRRDRTRRLPASVETMAEDFRWTIAGNGKWSRTYDKQAVLNDLFPALRSRIEGRIKMISQRFIADGDYVVVEARGDNITRAGAPYNNSYCFVFRLAGGK